MNIPASNYHEGDAVLESCEQLDTACLTVSREVRLLLQELGTMRVEIDKRLARPIVVDKKLDL